MNSRWTVTGPLATGMLFCFFMAASLVNCVAAENTERSHMQLSSSAFKEGEAIPAKYTCDVKDVSPPLKWSGAPAETKSLSLIADEPDAPVGTWVHWVLYDLPPSATQLPVVWPTSQFVTNAAQ